MPLVFVTELWYYYQVNNKQEKTLQSIFQRPIRADISWSSVLSLFLALGAKVEEGAGSRIHVELNGEDASFHRPHPQKETDKGTVVSVRRFLENAGVRP
jgi:hypothetical protein